ncbi:MAG: hypothetical protein O7G85_05660, partial [Planctomycetota bacterium]|nr:hypothetical protein [Planctomycetota bacterium]
QERLQRALSDVGLELTPTQDRLNDYNSVQNTYLAIFQMLGGLGLLLGSVGLGIVVLRNVLERRSELALLRAVGYSIPSIRLLIRREHVFMLTMGLLVGVIAALVAILPSLRSSTSQFPFGFTLAILVALIANGLFWVWLATQFAVTGSVATSLQEN